MKSYLLTGLILFFAMIMHAQDTGNPAPEKTFRFHAGINYSYSNTSLKVTDFSAQSVWFGQDLGTFTADGDEIDRMNDLRTDETSINTLAIKAGMIFFEKPGSKWFLDASVLLGLSGINSKTDLDQPFQNKREVKSGLKSPMAGIELNLRYNLSPRWGITLLPEGSFSWGKTDDITDSINPMNNTFENDLTENFKIVYGRVAIMASFSAKSLIISAGPGFHYLYYNSNYKIDRTNPETGYEFSDELETGLSSDSFIDGCIQADWFITDRVTFTARAAISNDLFINAGINYNF